MSVARVTPPHTGPAVSGGQDLWPIGLDTGQVHLGVERLEERARALAAGFTLSRQPRRGPNLLLRRLAEHARVLRHAYSTVEGHVRPCEASQPATERRLDLFPL